MDQTRTFYLKSTSLSLWAVWAALYSKPLKSRRIYFKTKISVALLNIILVKHMPICKRQIFFKTVVFVISVILLVPNYIFRNKLISLVSGLFTFACHSIIALILHSNIMINWKILLLTLTASEYIIDFIDNSYKTVFNKRKGGKSYFLVVEYLVTRVIYFKPSWLTVVKYIS